jgi:hypothetical protein
MQHEDEYMQLRNNLTIDPNNLDEALINIAMEQMQIIEYTAEASAALDAAKFQQKQVVADVSEKIRQDPDNKGISETRVTALVPLYDEVSEANSFLIEAEQDHTLWRGLSDAVRTKSNSLRALAELTVSGYMTRDSVRVADRERLHQYRTQQSG